jgi:hypothetical protein
MRWPWSRRARDDAAAKQTRAHVQAADEAGRRADRHLADAKRLDPKLHRLAAQLAQLNDPDEFARLLAVTFKDRR